MCWGEVLAYRPPVTPRSAGVRSPHVLPARCTQQIHQIRQPLDYGMVSRLAGQNANMEMVQNEVMALCMM